MALYRECSSLRIETRTQDRQVRFAFRQQQSFIRRNWTHREQTYIAVLFLRRHHGRDYTDLNGAVCCSTPPCRHWQRYVVTDNAMSSLTTLHVYCFRNCSTSFALLRCRPGVICWKCLFINSRGPTCQAFICAHTSGPSLDMHLIFCGPSFVIVLLLCLHRTHDVTNYAEILIWQ